ncbi:REJ domain protein (macronuclear) [Tetrahymena thermophila SB210]|uniref:REJ domain protein n=1 Tax=Tetrahymena thermophila (strain SB210) TaxID=312017 RepID=Q22LS1_TETTS|nr:REJ domain protein [Tetrahymena thermophila SB210]EAR86195.2 REJ domain protein [Tetrahymena thermophila SB210]|eukprot:XP_976790.2 REJ domain protein [Tetrahymena thermophila SB210]
MKYVMFASQQDVDDITKYSSNTNCLNLVDFQLYGRKYLSGDNCISDYEMTIQYTPQNPKRQIYGFFFMFSFVVKFNPSTRIYPKVNINNVEQQGDFYYQIEQEYSETISVVMQNFTNVVDSLNIKLTPISIQAQYKTYIQCQVNCDKCDYNQVCLQCSSGFYYQQDTNQCVSSCNNNQFANQQNQCQLCDNNCASCSGSSSNNCLSCNPGKYYNQATNQCICDPICKTCDGPNSNNCLSCQQGKYYNSTTKQCICDLTCNTCDGPNNNDCLSCNPGKYYDQATKVCINCDPTCKTCNGPNSNNCLSCQQGKYYNQTTKQCICDPTCQTCDGPGQNNCLSCNSGLFYQQASNQCVQSFVQVVMEQVQAIVQVASPTAFSTIKIVLVFVLMGFKCQTCYSETRQMDAKSNICVCKNQNDLRNTFYQCSYQNIALVDATLSATSPKLTIDFGSPLINIISNSPQSLCSQIFDQATLGIIGLESQCEIKKNNIFVYLSDSSTIMENNSINILPNKLQFTDYSGQFINVFYRNITFQDPPGIPQLQFSYNHIENSCNSINITLYSIQNDAGRKFMSLNWTLNQIVGSISNDQFMSLSYYFQFYIEVCELGQITYFNEPIDLQLVSNQLQKQSLSQYNQSSFQYDILPYSLASNQTFNMSLVLNLSSDNKVTAIQNISVNVQITDLYLQIIGGSSLVLGYQNKMVLNTESRDYEIQDHNSVSNINFSWKCFSLSSIDHICYDYQDKQIQLQQGASSISFPAKTFQPYTAIQLTAFGQKDSRQSNFTTTCIFTELDIPPLKVLFSSTPINQKINLNDDLNFQIIYGENISSDYLSYSGAIIYDSNAVAAIKFDYFQIRFRIWNYFQKIDPSKITLQIRFSVYNPLFVLPSLSTINIQINIPPQNCVLNVNPLQGISLETIFQIQLLNCQDEDLPLTYQFFYYNSADDANSELVSPWNILRRQIQDQTINNSIQTILPQGNLVVMVQVMDSYLGVYNSSSIVQVQAQNKSVDEYYKLVNQLTSQSLQSSNIQITSQLVTLSIIAEDISKNNQLSQQLNDLVGLLIQKIQQLSLQIPQFSLLSTFANKVTAQLSQLFFNSSYQNNVTILKNKIFAYLQTILQNTNSSIQNSNLSHLQQNNDIQIQNMVDSFKTLNSSVSLYSNNSYEDFQSYDKISTQIGNLLNNISLPNQGQITLNGDLSTLLSDKITQKNLFKYVININENSENQTSVFSITRNNYKQNIYENTSYFQAYTQKFKNISQNFTYSKNEVISPQIYNSSSQKILNQSNIVYQFNDANSSKLYNMTCLQQNDLSWSKQNCGISMNSQNSYMCLCASQKPTTIIEDIDDMLLKNKNLQTVFGEQGLQNLASFENFYIFLDKQTVQKRYSQIHNQELNTQLQNEQQDQQQVDENNQNICENSQTIKNDVFHDSPFSLQFKSNDNIQPDIQQNQQILSPIDQKRGNLNQVQEENIEMNQQKVESNEIQITKQQSSCKSAEKIQTQTQSQTQKKEIQNEDEKQKINVYLQQQPQLTAH